MFTSVSISATIGTGLIVGSGTGLMQGSSENAPRSRDLTSVNLFIGGPLGLLLGYGLMGVLSTCTGKHYSH